MPISCNSHDFGLTCAFKQGNFPFLHIISFSLFLSSRHPCRKNWTSFLASLSYIRPTKSGLLQTYVLFYTRSFIFGPAKTWLTDTMLASRRILWSTIFSKRSSRWVIVSINSLQWDWWDTTFVFLGLLISKRSIVRLCRRWWACSPALLVSVWSFHWVALCIWSVDG